MISRMRLGFLCGLLMIFWGCEQKSAKLQKSVVPPDKTLFETGSGYMKKSQYIKARLTFQTLINTYPDSEVAPDALFSIGDSYYDEGGMENLLQAEDQFKNFITFFPASPKAPDAQLKVIAVNMKQMRSPDRDQKFTYIAEKEIYRFKELYPNHDYVPIVNQFLVEVQENLAKGDLDRGQFYADRGNNAGALGRWREIPTRYENFSSMDDVYYRMASVLEKSNNPDEAAIYYGKIFSGYPFSKRAEEAKARLIAMGKPVPEVDTKLAALNQARLKPAEGFSPLKPLIDFGKALGFAGPPDRYELAKKTVEAERTKTAEAIAKKTGEEGKTGEDIQIQDVLRKSAPSGTPAAATVSSASPEPNSSSGEAKKKNTNKNRKKNTPKS
jgi:outer membrane protein assembly factor BamD